MSREYRVLPSAQCRLRPPNCIALLCDLDLPSKQTQQGIIKCTTGELNFHVHYSSIPATLLKEHDPAHRAFILLPEWMKTRESIINFDQIHVEKIESSVLAARNIMIRPLTRPPCLSSASGLLKGAVLTKSMLFSLKLSGMMVPYTVVSVEALEGGTAAEGQLMQITDDTEVRMEEHLQPSIESPSTIFDQLYADDVSRMMMYAGAMRMHISGEYRQTCLHVVVHRDERVLAAFTRALKISGSTDACIELDLYGLADDDEIEIPVETFNRRIDFMFHGIAEADARLIHIHHASRLSSADSIKRLHSLLTRIQRQLPETEIILTDTERPVRLLKLLGRSDGFRVHGFDPSPLNHQQRKMYLLHRLPQSQELEAAIDASKWRLGGLDLCALDRIVEAVERTPGDDSLSAALRTAIDELGPEGRPSYIRMLGRGLGSWDRLQGYEEELNRLRSLLYGPWLEKERYARFGITRSPGILLHGPSGCGKTSVVRAIANDSIFNVLEIDMAALKSRYLGETEERLRTAFSMARQDAPCILFIDGVDALGKRRGLGGDGGGSESGGAEERLLSTLLNEMDGIDSLGDVIVIGCSSRPELIDSALKRPGRLELHVELCLPRPEDRLAIIKHRCSNMNISDASEEDLAALVEASEGQSVAQIIQGFQAAGHRALMRSPDNPAISVHDISFS